MKTILQKNIDRYMDRKGIKFYSQLLYEIGKLMGKTGDESREFAEKEKSNFSKTLKGERPLKYNYIIPLEKIFGVPLAKLMEEQIYFENINKQDIPYLKNFRYYALKDDPELFDELDKMATIDGDNIINNSDEYNRYFFDYLIEYKAYNGLIYLINKHQFHLDPFDLHSYFIDESSIVFATLPIQISKFIVDSNDPKIFNMVYSPFEHLIKYFNLNAECIYFKEEFIEAIVNNDKIFDSLFSEREFSFEFMNEGIIPKDGNKRSIHCVNPLLNICLEYCLKNLNLYKILAEKILRYGIVYNRKVLDSLKVPQNKCYLDGIGNLLTGYRYYYANLIFTNIEKVEDNSINELIKLLPKIEGNINYG